jgi:hypothetical protein
MTEQEKRELCHEATDGDDLGRMSSEGEQGTTCNRPAPNWEGYRLEILNLFFNP